MNAAYLIAQRLAAAYRIRVFPCYGMIEGPSGLVCSCMKGAACGAIGKHPRLLDWTRRASFSEWRIAKWQAQNPTTQWAVLTGGRSGVEILDFDNTDALPALEKEYGPLPPTWRTDSGRVGDGWSGHLWFRVPDNSQDLRTVSHVSTGFDVRGWGGQAILPGSLHRSGRAYRFAVPPNAYDLPELPPKLRADLPKKEESSTPRPKAMPIRRVGNAHATTKAQHDSASLQIGDGPDGGGFNRPIRVRCCQYWSRGGTDERVEEFKAALRGAVLRADASHHTPEQIARYAGDDYLSAELASAKDWIISQASKEQ